MKEFILPTPIAAIQTLFQGKFRWPMNFTATFYEVVGGFLVSGLVGVILGVAVVWSEWLKRTIFPFLVLLNSLPKIAVAPLFMIWLGYGILPNILIVFLISFFPVVINTATGLVAVEEGLLDLVNYLHATKWQKMKKIQLPNSLPYIFSGLKIAAKFANKTGLSISGLCLAIISIASSGFFRVNSHPRSEALRNRLMIPGFSLIYFSDATRALK